MQVATAIGAAELPLKRSNQLLNQLWITMKNTARWRLTTGALNSFIGGLQQAFGYSKSLNASLNDIRIVSGKSADEMARFAKEANQAAKELSTTTTTYTDASLIYYQQGLDDKSVKERTDATIKMANVTGQSAETISSQMTAVWNNFREGSRTLESYADTMVALGASTASSSKEIAEGLEKFAPIANSVGLSFDYASAALATLVATTRESASVAGNALKTLFSRLEGLKLGETLDDGTDLNKYSQALYTVGINIKDTNGELKDMDVILTELGNRWKDLARDEQMALAQTVGGVRQYAQLVALMDNWQVFQQNLTTARTAEGSLEKQAQIYAESWEAARDRVKAASEDVYDSLINPKVFIDLDKMAQAVLKPLASILDAVGGLTGLLPIVAALMTKVYSTQIAGVIRDMAINIGLMTGKEQERVRVLQSTAAKLTEGLYSTYDDKSSASAKMSILRDYVSLQGELNTKADQYNEFQMEQIKNGLAIVEIYKNQALVSQDTLEKTQSVFDEAQDKFDSFIKETAQLGKIKIDFGPNAEYSQIIKNLTLIDTKYADLTASIKNGDIKQFLGIVNDGIDQITQRSVKLDTLKNILGETDQTTSSWKNNVIDLANELGLLGDGIRLDEEALEAFKDNPKIFEELRNKVSDSGEAVQEVYQNFAALLQLLNLGTENAEGLQTVFYSLINYTKELAKNGYDAETSLKALTEVIEKLKNYKPQQEPMDLANSFVAVANGASRAAMAVRSVTNIVETFSDTTISASEKLTRSLTSLAMILPVITNTIKGIAAGGTAAIGGWATIAVAAIVVIVKVLDKFIVTQKEASKAIQESVDTYKEAASELKSLENELKTTQDRIKELQELAESGSISVVEQEELRDLQIENDKLERQLELKKELARIKFKETLSEYQQNGGKAYTLPKKDTSQTYLDVLNALPIIATNQVDSQYKGILADYLAKGSTIEDLDKIAKKDERFKLYWDQYKEVVISTYDEIQTIIEKNNVEWLNDVGDRLTQAEALYDSFIDNIEDVSDVDLHQLQKQLAELRQALYGDKYGENVLGSVLNQLSDNDIQKLLTARNSIYSDIGEDLILRSGVTKDELYQQYSKIWNEAKTQLSNLNISEDINNLGLGYQELDLIAKFTVDEDSEFTAVQQFFNFLRANSGVVPISLQVQTIEDARAEALTALASGEMLSDEMIAKLQEVYTGIKDIANFSELSVKDQIEFLTNEGKVAEETVKNLDKRYKDLDAQLSRMKIAAAQFGKTLEDHPLYVATKLEFDEVEKELEKLKQDFERDPWKIRIEAGNEIGAQLNNVKKALALINEDLTVNADNLVELAKRYPEALVKATYDQNQNLLKLDEERYNNLQTLLNETLDATRDTNAQALLDAANTAFGILNIVKDTEEGKRDQSNITLDNILSNNQEQMNDIKRISLQALIQVAKSEKEKRQQQLDTMIQQVSGAKSAADTMAKNAEITAQNYSAAADTILKAFDTAFRNIATGSAALASGQYTSIWSQGWNQSSAKYEKGVSDLSVYQKNIADVKSSPEYKTLEAEIKLIDPLINALQNYYETGENYDKILEALKGFSELPDEIAGVLNNLNLNIGDISTGAASIFGDGFVDALITGFADDNAVRTAFETMLDDPRTAEALAGAAQNVYDDLVTALSNLLESPEIDKTKSGSGGVDKSSITKLDEADLRDQEELLEEIEDRYHEINRELERQERVLTKLDHQLERTYGLDRLKLYEEKIEELNKLYEDQRTKSIRATQYLNQTDTPRLQKAFEQTNYDPKFAERMAAKGINFAGAKTFNLNINPNTHEIQEFEKLEADINADVRSFMDSYHEFMVLYDNFFQEYEALTDEEKLNRQKEAEQWKLDYELVKLQFELVEAQQKERLAAIEQYESTLDTINTLAHEREDTLRQIEDEKLNEITYRMDVILDVRDARKQIRDFSKEIAESFGDALTHGAASANLGWEQAKDEMAMYKEYVQEYNDLKGLLDNANEYTDTTAIIAELKELEGNIIESGQRLLEWFEQVENMFIDALSAASARFKQFTDQLSHDTTILGTIKELYALQGITYKVEGGFAQLMQTAEGQYQGYLRQAQLNKEWYEDRAAELAEAEKALEGVAETDIQYDALKKNRDALLAEANQAQAAMLENAKAAMETLRQMYLDEVEKMSYDLEQQITGGQGLDLLREKYDHYLEENERYLDNIEESLETSVWYTKLQKDIDTTTNKAYKERLTRLQKEIDIRREGNTLSKYDLELLEAKYKVAQAQAALEDAQNNKNKLRLVRDSNGNWNYQFTADQGDLVTKEEDLLRAKQNEYEITKTRYKELNDEMIRLAEEFAEKDRKIRQDMAEGILTEEEGTRRLQELQKYYESKTTYLQNELNIAKRDMTEAAVTSATLAATLTESVYDSSNELIQSIVDVFKKEAAPQLAYEAAGSLTDLQKILAGHVEDFQKTSNEIKAAIAKIISTPTSDGSTIEALVNSLGTSTSDLAEKLSGWTGAFEDTGTDITSILEAILNGGDLDGISVSEFPEALQEIAEGSLYEVLMGDGDSSYSGLAHNMAESFTTQFDSIIDIISDNFIPAVEKYMPEAAKEFEKFTDRIEETANAIGIDPNNLQEMIEDLIDDIEDMYDAGYDAIDMMDEQLDIIRDLQDEYLQLAEDVWEYIYALQALAAEQVVPAIEEASGVNTFDDDEEDERTPFSYSGDLSQRMAQAWYNYDQLGLIEALEDFNDFVEERHSATSKAGITDDTDEIIETIQTASEEMLRRMANKEIKITVTLTKEDSEKAISITGKETEYAPGYTFGTGGYTGEWGDEGRLAFLHEKELVLNEDDTKNILTAVNTVRALDGLFSGIASQLDSNGIAAMSLLGSRLGGFTIPASTSTDLEQHVIIESVSFPGVTSSREIEEAFENLVNDAAQWARRRKS